MRYGVIGDVHLGFKAYETDQRSRETLDTFKLAVASLKDCPVILIQELFDETVVPNWIKKELLKIKEDNRDQVWVVLGGNHDSTKTYSSVSMLDAFAEVYNVKVANSHAPEVLDARGLKLLCVPHMRSQKEFLETLDEWLNIGVSWDAVMLHCMVNSKLDLGPNDLNIDMKRLELLSSRAKHVWMGHEHTPWQPLANAYVTGSIMEFDFGQLGPKFAYSVEETAVTKILIPQPRKMLQHEWEWTGPVQAMQSLQALEPGCIHKVIYNSIPVEEASLASNTASLFASQYDGTVLFDLRKLGHKELKVTAIDASLDLMEEFELFAETNDIQARDEMLARLEEAIALTISEDEEAAA